MTKLWPICAPMIHGTTMVNHMVFGDTNNGFWLIFLYTTMGRWWCDNNVKKGNYLNVFRPPHTQTLRLKMGFQLHLTRLYGTNSKTTCNFCPSWNDFTSLRVDWIGSEQMVILNMPDFLHVFLLKLQGDPLWCGSMVYVSTCECLCRSLINKCSKSANFMVIGLSPKLGLPVTLHSIDGS